MGKKKASRTASAGPLPASEYRHSEASSPLRPDVGAQSQFRKKKEPATYRYDSSLSPSLDWDTNPAREQADALMPNWSGRSPPSPPMRPAKASRAQRADSMPFAA